MTETSWPWPSGAATGIGSLPGTDIAEAQRVVLGELPELPYLPELPARGPGADLIGRTAGLLVELPVELYAAQWRVAGRPGRELRRARDLMERDLDQLAEQAEGYTGSVKIQAAGPWTMAAAVDLPIGGRLLRDPGAVRDLTGSLAEGLRTHVTEVRRRLPGATVLLQLDEPALPAVLAARVPTESGLGAYRAVRTETARDALRTVIDAVETPVFMPVGTQATVKGMVGRQVEVEMAAEQILGLVQGLAVDRILAMQHRPLRLFDGQGQGQAHLSQALAGQQRANVLVSVQVDADEPGNPVPPALPVAGLGVLRRSILRRRHEGRRQPLQRLDLLAQRRQFQEQAGAVRVFQAAQLLQTARQFLAGGKGRGIVLVEQHLVGTLDQGDGTGGILQGRQTQTGKPQQVFGLDQPQHVTPTVLQGCQTLALALLFGLQLGQLRFQPRALVDVP